MKRMYSLDLLKLVLAYVVAFFHIGTHIAPGSTVAVQIFFIISGFFLARKYYSAKDTAYSQWDYTVEHVKSLYPHYLFSLIMIFLYMTVRALVYLIKEPSWDQVNALFLSVYNQIPDILLLQSTYHFHDSMNYPLWQISSLLVSGYFVYALLNHNEKTARCILFPAAILMIQSILHTGFDIWGNYGPFYMPLLRAFSPMCIGVLAYYFTTTNYYTILTGHKTLFNILSILCLISIFTYGDYDIIFLITTPIVIIACLKSDSWINALFNRKIFKHCGKLSYAVYLNHALIQRFTFARLFPRFDSMGITVTDFQKNLIYFIFVTVYSVITMLLVERITKFFRNKSAKVLT